MQGCGSIGISPLPAPQIFNILVGDIAHNLRSALDHVAGEITSLATNGNKRAIKNSKFPMSSLEQEFMEQIETHISPRDTGMAQALNDKVVKSCVIRRALIGINKLNNTDKHQAVVVLMTQVGVAAENVRIGGATIGRIEAVDCGAMIGNFSGNPMIFGQAPHATIEVKFGDGQGFEDELVIQSLRQASAQVSLVIKICEESSSWKSAE
jgi:hypothetical protein